MKLEKNLNKKKKYNCNKVFKVMFLKNLNLKMKKFSKNMKKILEKPGKLIQKLL